MSLPDLNEVADPAGMERAIRELGQEPEECPVCAVPGPLREFHKQGKWFWSCGSCGLVFVHDIYPEFAAEFDEEGYGEILSGRTGPKSKERRYWERLFDRLERRRELSRLLEVGCGEGFFLAAARERGWEPVGIEILPTLVRRAREERGLDVREGDVFDADLPAEAFDVVYMNEVIEHVVDPLRLLVELHRILRPGGVVVVRTGNARSWSARVRGGTWWYYWFCGHGHIRFFSPSAARALARRAGFARADSETRGFALFEGAELRGRWYRPLVRLVQAPLSPLAGLADAGHRLTAFFEK